MKAWLLKRWFKLDAWMWAQSLDFSECCDDRVCFGPEDA